MLKFSYASCPKKRTAKAVSALCAASFLSACANPIIAKDVVSDDYKLSCQQLSQEIGAAEFALNHARRDDRFRLSYVMILPAAVSYMRMSEAEEAAQKRVDGLTEIAQRKQCDLSSSSSAEEAKSDEKNENNASAPIQQAPTAQAMRPAAVQQPAYAPPPARAPMGYAQPYQAAVPYQQPPYAGVNPGYPPQVGYPQAAYPPAVPGNPVPPPMR